MGERRINPDTGVYEENTGFIFDNWEPGSTTGTSSQRYVGHRFQLIHSSERSASPVNPTEKIPQVEQL